MDYFRSMNYKIDVIFMYGIRFCNYYLVTIIQYNFYKKKQQVVTFLILNIFVVVPLLVMHCTLFIAFLFLKINNNFFHFRINLQKYFPFRVKKNSLSHSSIIHKS